MWRMSLILCVLLFSGCAMQFGFGVVPKKCGVEVQSGSGVGIGHHETISHMSYEFRYK